MKNYNELVSRSDEIQDLPVSEEMLGAYLEGNLSLYEMEEIGNVVNHTPLLQSIIEDNSISILDDSNTGYDEAIHESFGDSNVVEVHDDNPSFFDDYEYSDMSVCESIIDIDSSDNGDDTHIDDLDIEFSDLPLL